MNIPIPDFSMVMLVGTTSSGKSTLARRHFQPTEIVASDDCRAMIADDPNAQQATSAAFELLHFILAQRLRARRLTVVDASNLEANHRHTLLQIAQDHDCPTIAIVLATDLRTCLARNSQRSDRNIRVGRVRNQHAQLRKSIRGLRKEGFRRTTVLRSQQDIDSATFTRTKPRLDRQELTGPFDIIGDIHGCHQELLQLLTQLGYDTSTPAPQHPQGRTAVFLGDLVDRGPGTDQVLETVMNMTQQGTALCVAGNHENKLLRHLKGNPVTISHGLASSIEQIQARPQEFQKEVQHFLDRLPEHYLLDTGRLAVAHAGVLEEYQGRISGRIRNFCLYGQTNGETDEWGLPVRQDWALDYRGPTTVVYGHTPVDQPHWTNNTINIDTGCVFGGSLTALRYPERELVSVPAARTWYEPIRPDTQQHQENSSQEARQDVPGQNQQPAQGETATADSAGVTPDNPAPPTALHLADVTGGQQVQTRLRGQVHVDGKHMAAALENMSRFAMDPRWLVYLPPTMSPGQTSDLPGLIEHPREALEQYRQDGVQQVICQEKHMGSRGIVILAQDPSVIQRRFGVHTPDPGTVYTRTGRRFFTDPSMEQQFLQRARQAADDAGLWDRLESDWVLMDCEIMPWSLKAHWLVRNSYAPTGTAAVNTLEQTQALLLQAAQRGIKVTDLVQNTQARLQAAQGFRQAYRNYCWDTSSLDQVRVAPFHFLAGEKQVFSDQDHAWHLSAADSLHQADPGLFQQTGRRTVDLSDPNQEEEATRWWTDITQQGGEGMVVKPLEFLPQGRHDHVQPAIKVRGPEYLRIIYGPEYDLPGNIERMRRRGLHGKRSMALREFALGLEGLSRFVDNEPLHRVHQCAFAVLAMESEPVDPRL